MGQTPALTGADQYTLVTNLLDGNQIDSVLFYQLLGMVKTVIEGQREWKKLQAVDISQTASPSNTIATTKNCPADFGRFMDENPLLLYDPNNVNDWIPYTEAPIQDKYMLQNDVAKFVVDYTSEPPTFILLGKVDKTRTIQQNYIKDSPYIAAATSWVFPTRFHPILAFGVAAIHKSGIDFDSQAAAQAIFNDATVEQILQQMINWDSLLQVNSLKGRDRTPPDNAPFYGGRINQNLWP